MSPTVTWPSAAASLRLNTLTAAGASSRVLGVTRHAFDLGAEQRFERRSESSAPRLGNDAPTSSAAQQPATARGSSEILAYNMACSAA